MTKAVRMTERIPDQYHDGEQWRSWPAPGEVGMFDDVHADHLVASGRGEYVEEQRAEPEKRPAPDAAEKRAAPRAARSAPRSHDI